MTLRWMSWIGGTLLVVAVMGGGRPALAEAGPYPVRAEWGHRPEFADGMAEVNTYQTLLTREGAPRETRAYTVFVAEDLDPEILVKADDPSREGLLRAFKYVLITSAQTGMMEYREAFNTFITADGWSPVKVVHSHQDWCGLTHKLWIRQGGESRFRWTGYWEEDGGSGERTLHHSPDVVPADALPVWVRGLDLSDGLQFDLQVLPSFQGSKVRGAPGAVAGRVKVGGPAEVTVRGGRFMCFEVWVEFGGERVRVSVERDFPHRVIRWTDEHGQSFTLVKSQREAYWARSADGDELLLEP